MNNHIILLLILFTMVSLVGCNGLNKLLLYSDVYIEHPESIQLIYVDDPNWWNYSNLAKIRSIVEDYLVKNGNIDSKIKIALRELRAQKGMSKEQVFLVIGPPTSKEVMNNTEILTYKNRSGIYSKMSWDAVWVKLKFQDNILIDLEVQRERIHK